MMKFYIFFFSSFFFFLHLVFAQNDLSNRETQINQKINEIKNTINLLEFQIKNIDIELKTLSQNPIENSQKILSEINKKQLYINFLKYRENDLNFYTEMLSWDNYLCNEKIGSISLRNKNKPLENHPIFDQDGLGVCFATSAALMHASILKKPVSYLDIALNYHAQNLSFQALSNKGGGICAAFNTMNDLCPLDLSLIESNLLKTNAKALDIESKQEKIFSEIDNFFKNTNELDQNEKKLLCESYKKNKQPNIFQKQVSCFQEINSAFISIKNISKLIKPLQQQLIEEIICKDNFYAETKDKFLKIIAPECLDKNKRIKANPKFKCEETLSPVIYLGINDDENLNWARKQILTSLKNNLPIGLSICSDLLLKTNSQIMQESKPCLNNHAVVITGYRWNPQKKSCEIEIWNSWSDGPNWYDEKILTKTVYPIGLSIIKSKE